MESIPNSKSNIPNEEIESQDVENKQEKIVEEQSEL